MKTILFSTDTTVRGGKERQMVILASELIEKGYHLYIACRNISLINNYFEEYSINEDVILLFSNLKGYKKTILLMKQQEELQYKKNLLLTRDRMLELSQEKNVYKQKVIFTLLATIFAIILLMVIVFLYLR